MDIPPQSVADFGMVTMRFEAQSVVDSLGSKQVTKADWDTFISRLFAGIKEPARTA